MTQGPVECCTYCGTTISANDRFCTRCGAPRQRPPAATPASAAPAPTFVQQAGRTAATAQRAYGAVAQVAGVAGMATSLPWQTIVVGETPDLRAMLSRVAMPGARTLAQRSLKKPGLSMAATTVLDLVVAGISGGPAALAGAIPRALGGGLTALLSVVTGSKGGALRGLTGVVSLVTALVQVASLGTTFVGGLVDGAPFLTLAPMAVATTSALVMALKTASVALRRRS